MSLNNKKLLQIAYYFPPMGTVGTLPNYRFAIFFSKYFSTFHILTQKYPAIQDTQFLPLSFSGISRIFHVDYRVIAKLFSRKKRFTDQVNAQSSKTQVAFARKILDSFPTNLVIGEGGIFYLIGGMIKAFALQKEHQFDYVFSSFRPMTDLVIAYVLKRRYPNIFWIADFRDLSIDRVRKNVFWPNVQEYLLQKLLSRADLVTCASEGLRQQLSKLHGHVRVLQNGVHELYPIPEAQPTSHFTINYTGSIYPQFQDPQPLFKSLQQLISEGAIDPKTVRLQYAGKDELIWKQRVEKAGLSQISHISGLVNMEAAIRMQVDSQLNLMFSWSSEEQEGMLTAKLFDYLAARSPILCIVQGSQEKELTAIFTHTNAGLVYFTEKENQEQLSNFILDLYQKWKTSQIATKPISSESLLPYKTETQLQEILQLIESSE